MQQLPASEYYIHRHRDRDQGIEDRQAGQFDQADANKHPGGGPDIGEQMVSIRPQGDRIEAPRRLEQHPGHQGIDGGGSQGDSQTDAQLLQGLGILKAPDGGVDDRQRSRHDQHAFQAAGEVLGLEMAVVMGAIGGLSGQGQCPEGADGGNQVDPGLHGIGEEAHRAGEAPGQRLEHDRRDRRRRRQQHVLAG